MNFNRGIVWSTRDVIDQVLEMFQEQDWDLRIGIDSGYEVGLIVRILS